MKTKHAGALLFAIITAFVLSLVGATLVLLTTNQYRVINSEINRTIAFYQAQAGMEYAIYKLYSGATGWIPTGGDGSTTTHTLDLTIGVVTKHITVIVYDLPTTPPQPTFQNISDYGIQIMAPY